MEGIGQVLEEIVYSFTGTVLAMLFALLILINRLRDGGE